MVTAIKKRKFYSKTPMTLISLKLNLCIGELLPKQEQGGLTGRAQAETGSVQAKLEPWNQAGSAPAALLG